jgi:cyclic pyranopterin phosphate synthase
MPLDGDRAWDVQRVVSEREILERAATVAPLVPVADRGAAPARRWRFADGVGEIGIIASVTRPFCASCDRIRITADGKFRTCLFAVEETDLRGALRGGASDDAIAALLGRAVGEKWAGHAISQPGFVQPTRAMNAIGG